ncbi:MAG: ATP-binding protein [Actinomycetota bacterium]
MNHEAPETKGNGTTAATEVVRLTLPSRSDYVLLARLMVAQVGRIAGFGSEEVYDLKLAVTEAVTNVIRHAAVESFDVEYRAVAGTVEIVVSDAGGGFEVETVSSGRDGHGGFGLAVIRDLVDEMVVESAAGGGTRLKMIRRAGSGVSTGEG